MINTQLNTVVRPMFVGVATSQTRTISGLAEASGSGSETGLTSTGVLSAEIAGSGTYGFPGVEMYCESGGGLTATVLFYSATGALVTSSVVGSSTYSALGINYTIPASTPTNLGGVGTFYDVWKTLSVPIPSGTAGYLCGGFSSAIMTYYDSTYYPSGSDAGTVDIYLELGDSGVAATTLHVSSFSFATGYYGKASAAHEDVSCNFQFTAPALIAQIRGKVVVSAPSELTTPWTIGITNMLEAG